MEDNNGKQLPHVSADKGPLWAILLTVAMIVIMAVISRYVG